jgi:hypothetical protein
MKMVLAKVQILASSIENMISYSRSAIRIHKNYNFSPGSPSSKFYKDNFDTIATPNYY